MKYLESVVRPRHDSNCRQLPRSLVHRIVHSPHLKDVALFAHSAKTSTLISINDARREPSSHTNSTQWDADAQVRPSHARARYYTWLPLWFFSGDQVTFWFGDLRMVLLKHQFHDLIDFQFAFLLAPSNCFSVSILGLSISQNFSDLRF